jgi:CheY-like chemotaxis protein
MAAIHPSVLRQVLISMIDHLARQMPRNLPAGEILLEAEHAEDQARITLSGGPIAASVFHDFESIRALLSSFNIAADLEVVEGRIQFTLGLIHVDRCVLIVDDNTDMAHLYRRYLAGTRYYVQHVSRGEKAFAAIEQFSPQAVVLDVMLPDMDGWDLLSRMHENPATRSLPVVICSVMREKELAFALGARYFLSKPVQRRDFLTALDTVLQQA